MARISKKRQRVPPEITARVIELYGNDCWLRFPGCTGVGQTSDHIVPYHAGGATTVQNLRRACRHCNSARLDRVLSGYGAVLHMVIGPPEAGKTTYVRDHAAHDALVLDYDTLAEAIQPDSMQRSKRSTALQDVALGAWSGAYNRLTRCIEPVDVWCIKALPYSPRSPHMLDEWVALDYDIHVIDPGSATVFDRLAADNRSVEAEATARRWYALGLSQDHIDAIRALRHAQLRSVGLAASDSEAGAARW